VKEIELDAAYVVVRIDVDLALELCATDLGLSCSNRDDAALACFCAIMWSKRVRSWAELDPRHCLA